MAAKTYQVGVSGIWYQWIYLFLTPFYWLTTAIIRRMRAVTVSDFFHQRYSPSVALLFAIFGIFQLVVSIALLLRGTGVMVEAVSGGQITATIAIVVMTVLFVAYGMAGGLTSTIYTDVIQGILSVVFSFLIFPFALCAVGRHGRIAQGDRRSGDVDDRGAGRDQRLLYCRHQSERPGRGPGAAQSAW